MFRLILLTLLGNSLAKPYQQAETNFCTDKQPGLFSQGCSSNVTICNRYGKEMWLLCPFDLIFDGSIEECKDQKSVAECGSMSPERNSHVQDTKGLPNSLCEGSDDGYHSATECSNSVVQCVGGVSRLLECSMGQVFDNTQQSCVSPDDVPACRAADEASSTTTSSPSARIDCEGMTDGFFEKEPCSSFFLTCSGGISRILTCPANLVFDQKLTICEYPDNVEGCRAADGPSSQPSESSSASPSVCAEDGYFSYGNCSDTFYACTYGRQITMHCPAKLAFDESRQLCDYPFAVAICVEQESGNDAQGAAANSAYQAPEGEAQNQQSESTTAVPETVRAFCEGKKDGFYANGCSSEVIACRGGEASSMLCPSHMLYDEQKRVCEYPQNVPCYTAAKDQGAHETCSTEGPSANGRCNRIFTNCVEGKAYQLACDEGYVFSEEHRSCAESSKVKECSTAQSEPSTETNEQPEGGYSAPQGEESTPLPQQPSADAGYSAPQDQQSTPIPQQPSADAGYSAPQSEETTPLPQQPGGDVSYSAPEMKVPAPRPQQTTADARRPAQFAERAPPPRQPDSDGRYSAPEMKASAPRQQRPVDSAATASVARKPTPQIQQQAAEMNRQSPKSPKPTPQVRPAASGSRPAPGSQRSAADTGRQAPMSQKPISQAPRPATGAGHTAPITRGSAMRSEQPARSNVETKPQQY